MNKAYEEWLPLDVAAAKYGYVFKANFNRRIRQLRQQGLVTDLGRPPKKYKNKIKPNLPIVIMWPNPKTALIRSDVPTDLFDSRRGKRVSQKNQEKFFLKFFLVLQ